MRQTIGAPAMTPARNHQRVIAAARRPRPAAAYRAAPAAPGTALPSAANTVAKIADRPSSATQAMIEAAGLLGGQARQEQQSGAEQGADVQRAGSRDGQREGSCR